MLKQAVKSEGEFDNEFFDYLRCAINELCDELAEKFGLYTSRGEPRRAFILDTLMKYSCYGCIMKVLTHQRKGDRADALYAQNHRLAVNLLVEELRRHLKKAGLKPNVEGEVKGLFGRPDIVVRATPTGIIIEVAKSLEIVIEVKTGAGFTYEQVFRYLIERPNAVLVLWRVTRRQIIVIDGGKIRGLLLMVMEAALNRGTAILNGDYEECSHNPVRNEPYVIEDAQCLVDDFLSALAETIPSVVETVLGIIRSRLEDAASQQKLEAEKHSKKQYM